jgi:hypothetical protein
MLDLMTSQKFSILIETAVKEKRLSYMDAVVWWCEENEMEIEVAAKLCNGVLKEKIRYEAEELHFLEKSARLPI